MGANLDAKDPGMFLETAKTYAGQSGDLQGLAGKIEGPSQVATGTFHGRAEMVDAFNAAHEVGGRVLGQMSTGVGAYGSATNQLGNRFQYTRDLSAQLLGTVLNDSDRMARAQDPGGI